ncbi:MAG: hypothetical protein JST16_09955 [Bdellovibrionales bacterium]|nr:hypothetical protein [Bdellovibrionales bacterium]
MSQHQRRFYFLFLLLSAVAGAQPAVTPLRNAEQEIDRIQLKLRARRELLLRDQELRDELAQSDDAFAAVVQPAAATRYTSIVELAPANVMRSLPAMAQAGLENGKISEQPWSDSYWPTYQGLLGNRYADEGFGDVYPSDYQNYRNYVEKPLNLTPANIDNLSPSEKYDLVIGANHSQGLTPAMWAEGARYANNGKVETWMGICHGWAPASYREPRAQRAVVVKAADGVTPVKFYPSDIKGLNSLMWARARFTSNFVGLRCDTKNPSADGDHLLDPSCFDVDPADWHVSVVNQVGRVKKSFVIDSTYDYEVWNQPVVSYRYQYFNPMTNKYTHQLKDAVVVLSQFPNDPFRKYRKAGAVQVVGISMELSYVGETAPSHSTSDSPVEDRIATVHYLYDLELDSAGNVVGGEWHQRQHPDFLWNPVANADVRAVGERYISEDWSGQGAIPQSWQKAALNSTANRLGQPLSKLVRTLTRLAH